MFPPLGKNTKGPLDALPEKTAGAGAKAMSAQNADGGAVDRIDAKVIPLLERIERNTRRGAAAAKATGSRSTTATVAVQKAPITPSQARAERKATAPMAEMRQPRRVSSPRPGPAVQDGAPAPSRAPAAAPVQTQAIAGAVAKATRGVQDRKRSVSGRFVAGESMSARALRESRGDAPESPEHPRDSKFWGKDRSGEAADAAGSASAGPIWGAVMEMKEFAGKMREDGQSADPNSIRSILSQKIQDKTGVTAIKGHLAKATDKLHGKVLGMVGGAKPAALAPPAKVTAKPVPVKFETPPSQGGGDSGGIGSLLGDFAGKGLTKLGGKMGGRFGKVLSGAGMLLGGGEGMLGGGAASAATGAAEGVSGAAGGVAKAGGGMLGKVMGGGAKFLGRAAGPIAALAMNLPDLIDGVKTGDSEKTGGAVGGMAGSLSGGMAGAAIGTAILPGVGTLIGGAIGAFAGDFLGGKAGKAIGGTMFGGVKKSVDDLNGSIAELDGTVTESNADEEKKANEPPATGVNWSGGGLMDMLSSAGTSVKRFFTGEKVAPIAGSDELGSLSAKYESGSKGSEAVGFDNKGGTSYGKFQIATRTGTMDKFMDYAKENNPALYERLKAAGPADSGKNGKFAQEWQGSVADGTMGDTERGFIKKSHFDPAFQGIRDAGLRDQISGSKTMQDVLMSTAVQHGGGGCSGHYEQGLQARHGPGRPFESRLRRAQQEIQRLQRSSPGIRCEPLHG